MANSDNLDQMLCSGASVWVCTVCKGLSVPIFRVIMVIIESVFILNLKMPRKPASENVVCLCCLLNILANFSNLFLHTNSVDPDQTAPRGAV